MIYCQNKPSATVAYKNLNNVEEKFTTKDVPIDFDCRIIPNGRNIYTVRTSGYQGDCIPTGLLDFTTQQVADSYQITNDAIPVSGFERCTFFNVSFFIEKPENGNKLVAQFRVTTQFTISSIPNIDPPPTLTIKSGSGGIFTKQIKSCDSIVVTCGDECPPNHIKCPCDSYPGYCCIPCSEIRNGIAAATAAVRGINRG